MRSARALPGCLARCPVGSPSALRGVFSPDSPGPPRCGVSPFSHRPNSVQDHPALGAAQGHPSLPPSAPPPQHPARSWGAECHARRSAPNSQLSPRTGPEDLCVALEDPVLDPGAHTASVLGCPGWDQLGRSSWVGGVVQAFRPRAGPFGAPLRAVATWGRTLCLFETRPADAAIC